MANPMDLQLGCGVGNDLVISLGKNNSLVPVIRLRNMKISILKRHVLINEINIHGYQTTLCVNVCVCIGKVR